MLLLKQQLDQLIKQTASFLQPPPPEVTSPSVESTLLDDPPTTSHERESLPPVETDPAVDLVWFDRGINLDEIERQSAYRNRRKITTLDG